MRSEDSWASPGPGPAPAPGARLLPGLDALLATFERVNRITEEVHGLELSLEEAQGRARERRRSREGRKRRRRRRRRRRWWRKEVMEAELRRRHRGSRVKEQEAEPPDAGGRAC